jgi:glycosyltransferase involved in cell wall biosynthesis
MKLVIVTDAWEPQINGVVKTLSTTKSCLESLGYSVTMLTPADQPSLPCPTYPEIRLALLPGRRIATSLETVQPDYIHIATEGPMGISARRYCRRRGLAFTTSYHTQFPQYVRQRLPIAPRLSYAVLRRFHSAAVRTLVGTKSVQRDLGAQGFENLAIWPRGVDTDLFKPGDKSFLDGPRPIWLYAGRVAVEKNIEAFLTLELPGSKYVVGDGPGLHSLRERYCEVHFTGYRFGEELASYISAADVFVFPSRTDTFGLVLLEALACGVPVAAYPVTGPKDVLKSGVTGVLREDLRQAAMEALKIDGRRCREQALDYTWEAATQAFLNHLVAAR